MIHSITEQVWFSYFMDKFDQNLLEEGEKICGFTDCTKEKNKPDFILDTSNGRKIGVEVTQLMNPKEKQIESSRAEFLKCLETKHQQVELPPAKILISFDTGVKINNSEKIINESVMVIKEMIQAGESNRGAGQLSEELARFISLIQIVKHKSCKYEDLTVYSSTFYFEQEILEVIQKKEKRLSESYALANLDEYWLLICIDDSQSSGAYEIHSDIINKCIYRTNFDKLLLMSFFGSIHQLPIELTI